MPCAATIGNCDNFHVSIVDMDSNIYTGCPKKKGDLRLNAPRGLQKGATDKSWVSFEKFRKFPV